MKAPVVVGLVGGIASGKSTVARLLQAHGALWIDADKQAHAVLQSAPVIAQLRARFGDTVIDSKGQVDRRWIAERVFGDSVEAAAQRRWLEQLIHPLVRAQTEARLADEGPNYPVVIIDAPLLIEAGWAEHCDRILLVDTPWPRRVELAAARGWSSRQLQAREASQLPLSEKRLRATDIILNAGSIADLEQAVSDFWKRIT